VVRTPPTDPGLAPERTALAWNRSGVAVIVCIAVLLRHVWPIRGNGEYVAIALVAVTVALWAVVLLVYSHAQSRAPAGDMLGPRVFSLMTAGTLVLAGVGLVLAFFTPN
jgi:uncharacterized membrane protein YidH (DUF202 family)